MVEAASRKSAQLFLVAASVPPVISCVEILRSECRNQSTRSSPKDGIADGKMELHDPKALRLGLKNRPTRR